MKANELMIGDWVRHKGKPIQVEEILDYAINPDWAGAEIDSEILLEDISPIPLTPEILEKNGWKTTDRYRYNCADVWFDIIERDRGDFDIEVSAYDGGFAYVATIYYVHELQHALRLCGIEKEIAL